MDMGEAFARAYKDGQWHNGSGSGSSPANTLAYREFLARYMREHEVRSVLDLGCGDWQTGRLIDWTGIDYLGIDIVPELVDSLTAQFSAPGVRFCQGDASTMDLPPADLVLCKDLLQHWPDDAIFDLISGLTTHRALITYDYSAQLAADIEPGGHRPLDLASYYGVARHVKFYQSVSHEGMVRRWKVITELLP